jgi:hypothetical protein
LSQRCGNRGMAKHTWGHRLALSRNSPPQVNLRLVGWLVGLLLTALLLIERLIAFTANQNEYKCLAVKQHGPLKHLYGLAVRHSLPTKAVTSTVCDIFTARYLGGSKYLNVEHRSLICGEYRMIAVRPDPRSLCLHCTSILSTRMSCLP